ncbi:MAG: 3'-5' exonuclease [Myxococcota bacterium]
MTREELATRTEKKPTKSSADVPPPSTDEELERIVGEEEKVLARVARTLKQKRGGRRTPLIDYDAELVALRDQIRNARLEDIPPLIEEMERLQGVAQRRAKVSEGMVDPMAPYFGRLVLEENERKREVLIGRSTYLDSKTGVRIVDWRDAPVSRIYYRYEEGDDYEETFGTREIEGEVLVRRALSIGQGRLKRIGSPQGTFIRKLDGSWRRAGASAVKLSGGQGAAMRPEKHHKPGKLGIQDDDLERAEDKSLSEITALIDPAQFDLITKPTSGLVVIQGGAGSGKTTIGLHRLAYLAFQDRRRFRPDRMLVVVFNDALVRYIGRVLPALGVEGVTVLTYERWASKFRDKHIPHLPKRYAEDTPSVVTRFKKHPVMLRLIEEYAESIALDVENAILDTAKKLEGGGKALRIWRGTREQAPVVRAKVLREWLKGDGKELELETRHAIERALDRAEERASDVVGAWAEILTDKTRIESAFAKHAPEAMSATEIGWAHSWCARRIPKATFWREERLEAIRDGEKPASASLRGVDGRDEAEIPTLDREDDAILLRLHQRLVGPLMRKRERLAYEHMFVDETQDLSPLELAVVLETSSKGKSVTLAGDVAQKLYMDNGFTDWRSVLGQLGLDHVEIEPLRLSYRSTHEILDFATEVLGPLRNQVEGRATRHGAPVELFRFTTSGEAVAMLSEALRDLVRAEPMASVCVIARYPEQADVYFKGLQRGEVPNLRRIAEQDFPFRPGIDVTDVRQVKGLEFDYVVLVEANAATYPEDDEARHLVHIAATRAAHQLWVMSSGSPSLLIPEDLRKRV